MDCLFCKIVSGKIPSYKIYEDELVYAFLDINPDSNGHTLLIPKKHYLDMNDIPLDTLTHIFKVAKELKVMLEEKDIQVEFKEKVQPAPITGATIKIYYLINIIVAIAFAAFCYYRKLYSKKTGGDMQ